MLPSQLLSWHQQQQGGAGGPHTMHALLPTVYVVLQALFLPAPAAVSEARFVPIICQWNAYGTRLVQPQHAGACSCNCLSQHSAEYRLQQCNMGSLQATISTELHAAASTL